MAEPDKQTTESSKQAHEKKPPHGGSRPGGPESTSSFSQEAQSSTLGGERWSNDQDPLSEAGAWVQQNQTVSVAAAFGTGLLIGLLMQR